MAVIRAGVHPALGDHRRQADGAVGEVAPEFAAGGQIDAMEATIDGGAEVGATLGDGGVKDIVEADAVVQLHAFDDAAVFSWPG